MFLSGLKDLNFKYCKHCQLRSVPAGPESSIAHPMRVGPG
jgi:hypothetical protein